jgi:hypothetical protein
MSAGKLFWVTVTAKAIRFYPDIHRHNSAGKAKIEYEVGYRHEFGFGTWTLSFATAPAM